MTDRIIAYLAIIVILLLFIISFLIFYIIYEHRKRTISSLNKEKVVLPLLTLKTNDQSNINHSNSAIFSTTNKRMMKRLRHQVKFGFFAKKLFFKSFLAITIIYSYTKFSRFSSIISIYS